MAEATDLFDLPQGYFSSLRKRDEEDEPTIEFKEPEDEAEFMSSYKPGDFSGLARHVREDKDDDYEVDLEGIPTERKFEYGTAQETMILGNMLRYGEALVDSSKNKGLTFSEALEEVEDDRQREIFKKFPEFQGLRPGDEDAAIISGRVGTAFVDPVTWAVPWLKIAKAGKIASTVAGATFSAGDTALREKLVYGEVSPLSVGASTVIGGASGFVSAALASRINRRGVEEVKKLIDEPNSTTPVPLETVPEFRTVVSGPAGKPIFRKERILPLDSTDLDSIESAAKQALPETVVELVEKTNAALTPMLKKVREIRTQAKRVSKEGDKAGARKLRKDAKKLEDDIFKGIITHTEGSSEAMTALLEQMEKNKTLTDKVLQTLVYENTRPIIGGLAGATIGWASGEENDDAMLYGFIGAGMAAGYLQKRIQNSTLTSFTKNKAKFAIEDSAAVNLKMALKLYTSASSSTKLDALGGWAKVIGNKLLPRIGGGMDSVEAQTTRLTNEFRKRTAEIFGDSADDETITHVVAAHMRNFIDADVLKAGYRGVDGSLKPLTQEQLGEVQRIVPLLKDHQGTIKDGIGNVGIDIIEDLGDDFGMSQVWLRDKIRAKRSDFLKDLEEARKIQVKNMGKKNNFDSRNFMDRVGGIVKHDVSKPARLLKPVGKYDKSEKAWTYRGIAENFEAQRILKDTAAVKHMAEKGWLDMNAVRVVNGYGEKGLKVTNFARVFGAKGELITYALKDIEKTFNAATKKFGPQHEKAKENYAKHIRNTVEAYWGRHGLQDETIYRPNVNAMFSILTSLANTAYLPFVAISSLGDLIQPFQQSGFAFTAKVMAKRKADPKYRFAERTHFAHDDAWERELSAYLLESGDAFSTTQHVMNSWNRKFMWMVGQQKITKVGRAFAYDVGVNAAYDIAKNRKMGKSVLEEMRQLLLDPDDLKVLSKYDNITDAFEAGDARVIMDRAGQAASDRDAIIPMVGNRLLFTQNKRPEIRSFGQFLSWAQGKTAQTNALVKRIENGDAKQAVRMLGTIPIYMGVQGLKEIVKPSYDVNDPDAFSLLDPSLKDWSKGLSLSGNWLPWQVDRVYNALQQFTRTRDLGGQLSPAAGYVTKGVNELFNAYSNVTQGDVEGAISNIIDITPVAKELKGYGERFDFPILEDAPTERTEPYVPKYAVGSLVSKRGGRVEDVPSTAEEPDERVDKVTGVPYNEQAGAAFIDDEDPEKRAAYNEGGKLFQALKRRRLQTLQGEAERMGLFMGGGGLLRKLVEEVKDKPLRSYIKEAKKVVKKLSKSGEKPSGDGYDLRLPTAVRQFAHDIFGGEEARTEEYFKEAELKALKEDIVPAAIARGSTEIHYRDYPTKKSQEEQLFRPDSLAGKFEKVLTNPTYSVAKTIGEARITRDDDGNTIIEDRYNFNDAPDQFRFSGLVNDITRIGLSPMAQLRNIGKHLGSGPGEGSLVRINLGKLNLDKEEELNNWTTTGQ